MHVLITEANDHAPKFKTVSGDSNRFDAAPVLIPEDAAIGTLVLDMEAEDGDGDKDVFLEYKIIRGNELGHFAVKNG